MKRLFAILMLLFVPAVAFGQGQDRLLPLKQETLPILRVTNSVFDLSDDLGCVYLGKPGATTPETCFTPANGITNAALINQAISEGKSLGDKHGRNFPVAIADDANPYCIRFPLQYGGMLVGTGLIDRQFFPPNHTNYGTAFINTTDPNVCDWDLQEMIRIEGRGQWLGPFTLIGRYVAAGGPSGRQLVIDGEVAKYGIRYPASPAGKTTGAVKCAYLQEGIRYERDNSCQWAQLEFDDVMRGVVADDIQAVGLHIFKLDGANCGTLLDYRAGGELVVEQCFINGPCGLLDIAGPVTGSNRYDIGGIRIDAQAFVSDGERVTDLMGRPTALVRRSDGNNTARVAIRLSGTSTVNGQNWFKDHRMIEQLRGFANDCVLDISGIAQDEQMAFAAKATSADPTAFTLPDTAKGDDFEPPNLAKVRAWWDMSQDADVNGGTVVDGAAISTLATRFGEDWTLTPSTTAPTILNDGVHHRRAFNIGGSGRYLGRTADSSLSGFTELEVHVVAAPRDPGTSADREIVTYWRENANGRGWRIYIKRNDGQPDNKKVFAQISFDGTATGVLTLESEEPLGWDTPALITLRYNGTGTAQAGLASGEAELVVNGQAVRETRGGGGTAITGSSGTPLRIGVATNSGGGAMRGMTGRIAELAILNDLSSLVEGTDTETGATADAGELPTIRSYFRKKYGVW